MVLQNQPNQRLRFLLWIVVGVWVRQTRTQQNMSQRELADAAGLSRSYVCDIERGRGNEPSLVTLDNWFMHSGIPPDLMQASGLMIRHLCRRIRRGAPYPATVPDLTEDGQEQVMRYVRFIHADEHCATEQFPAGFTADSSSKPNN